MRRVVRAGRTALALLVAGLAVTVLVAWGCALAIDPMPAFQHRQRLGHTVGPSPSSPDRVRTEYAYAYERSGLRIVERHLYTRPPATLYHDGRGWPWPSLASTYRTAPTGVFDLHAALPTPLPDFPASAQRPAFSRCLPLQPVWPGLLASGLFWWAVASIVGLGFTGLRRRSRAWRGWCPACGYPAGAAPSCTECGGDLAGVPRRPPPGDDMIRR